MWRLTAFGTAETVAIGGAFVADSPGLLQRLAVAGMGIALLPELGAREAVASGRLQRVLSPWQAEAVPIHALTTTRLLPAKCRCFIEFLREQAAG